MIKLCLIVFFGRLVDVALGTIRTIISVKGKLKLSFIIGFIEALLYFLVVRRAFNNDINIIYVAISYAFGYALGILIGTYISHNLINDDLTLQAIVKKDNDIIDYLRSKGYIVSILELNNPYDDFPKLLLFISIKHKKLKELTNIIYSNDKNAYLTINETKHIVRSFI